MNDAQQRADRDDIAEILLRYATGIDRRDWDLFRTCFTDDVVAEYEGIETWTGADAITDFMERAHASMGHTLHRITNLTVSVAADADAATARSYVDVVLMDPDGRRGHNAVGFYDDDLVRAPDGWRIARRRFTPVLSRPV